MSKNLEKEVLFLQEKNAILHDENVRLHDKNMLLHEEIATIKADYEQALEAFKATQSVRFGRKNERFVDESGIQQGLFDAVDTTEHTEHPKPDPNDVEEITYKRAKHSKKQWDTTGIPHHEVIIPVEDSQRICGCCNAEKAVIGYESSQRLNYQPAVFEIITEKREKRACRNGCESSVITAPLRPRILPKCKATESLLAYICVSKVLDRQPLYHLEKAIAYALTHWDGLSVYMSDGRIEIDNNATERDIKPFVIARKNFLFACTPEGADALGVHLSLIITAQHHGLNPMAYYTELLKRIPTCETVADYESLLPWNLKG